MEIGQQENKSMEIGDKNKPKKQCLIKTQSFRLKGSEATKLPVIQVKKRLQEKKTFTNIMTVFFFIN